MEHNTMLVSKESVSTWFCGHVLDYPCNASSSFLFRFAVKTFELPSLTGLLRDACALIVCSLTMLFASINRLRYVPVRGSGKDKSSLIVLTFSPVSCWC